MTTEEALEEALGYVDHVSWRCGHPPHFYLADHKIPEGDCPCGLDGFLRSIGRLSITTEEVE